MNTLFDKNGMLNIDDIVASHPCGPTPPPFPGAGKFCTQCGAKLPDNARFCSNCGAPLN